MADDLANKLSAIDTTGKTRFGEAAWNAGIEAIKKAVPGGVPESEMRQVTNSADPAGTLMALGRHALMQQASDGDREAEDAYSRMRAEERKIHNERKGRVY